MTKTDLVHFLEESIILTMHALGFSFRNIKRCLLPQLSEMPFDLEYIVRHVISDDMSVSDYENDCNVLDVMHAVGRTVLGKLLPPHWIEPVTDQENC